MFRHGALLRAAHRAGTGVPSAAHCGPYAMPSGPQSGQGPWAPETGHFGCCVYGGHLDRLVLGGGYSFVLVEILIVS